MSVSRAGSSPRSAAAYAAPPVVSTSWASASVVTGVNSGSDQAPVFMTPVIPATNQLRWFTISRALLAPSAGFQSTLPSRKPRL
jgi:hypothetical protein